MHFTREPIVVTVVSPKEGCKLVVRNSKAAGQEEYFVDAVEVVAFGPALFFRSVERPKAFLLPVADYEVLEVRETRVVLKAALGEERRSRAAPTKEAKKGAETAPAAEPKEAAERPQRKRERRRTRRRRGREERPEAGELKEEAEELGAPAEREAESPGLSSILPPPSMLISERIQKVRAEEPEEPPPPVDEPASPPEDQPEKFKVGRNFSPSQLLRRLTGQEEEEPDAKEETEE